MTDWIEVTVPAGAYASVRAIEKSGVPTPATCVLVGDDGRTLRFEIRGAQPSAEYELSVDRAIGSGPGG